LQVLDLDKNVVLLTPARYVPVNVVGRIEVRSFHLLLEPTGVQRVEFVDGLVVAHSQDFGEILVEFAAEVSQFHVQQRHRQ